MLWFNSNKRIDKLEKQLIEINEALREERNNTKQLTKAVTQIYNLLAKVININDVTMPFVCWMAALKPPHGFVVVVSELLGCTARNSLNLFNAVSLHCFASLNSENKKRAYP
jgi:hypothetical protein